MHSFHSKNITIHHNGDFSGDAKICVFAEDGTWEEFKVPCEALVEFSKKAVVDGIISKLEQM